MGAQSWILYTGIQSNMDNRTSSLSDSGTAFENVPMDNKPRGAGAGIEKGAYDDSKVPFMTARTFFMCILVSMGGICFGYDTGQISGFLEMEISCTTLPIRESQLSPLPGGDRV